MTNEVVVKLTHGGCKQGVGGRGLKKETFQKFPDGKVVRTLPMQGAWVLSLVRALRSYKLCSVAK